MQNVLFQESKLIGVEFTKCDSSFLFSIHAEKSFIQCCNFSDLDMKKTSFIKSKIIKSTFINTVLAESDFSDTDLQETLFRHCNLSGANFSGASNYRIDPLMNKIKKAIFSFPDVIGLLKGFDIIIK